MKNMMGAIAFLAGFLPSMPAIAQSETGDVFSDCAGCPEMVALPAGSYQRGEPASLRPSNSNEVPEHRVSISRLAVGRYEVTFDEFDRCRNAGVCTHNPDDHGMGRGNRPVVDVNWADAQQYIGWIRQETGEDYRLLSESEWEYAARGNQAYEFPGEDQWSCTRGNIADVAWSAAYNTSPRFTVGCNDHFIQTAPVGTFRMNGFGLFDMAGNVWEWTQDCYNQNYNRVPTDGSAWLTGQCVSRIIRGGSWSDDISYARSAKRIADFSTYRSSNIGFRIARSLP